MKILKKFLQFSLLAILSIVVFSCSSDKTKTAQAKTSDVVTTRGMNRISSKAYYYKSLATFAAGGAPQMELKDLATLEGKKVNLVVLYEADAPWAQAFNSGKYSTTGDDNFNGVMASYELAIVKQFSIDEENEGLVLEAEGTIDNPVEAARELSMVDNVLMVHVKEVPSEETVTETAANN